MLRCNLFQIHQISRILLNNKFRFQFRDPDRESQKMRKKKKKTKIDRGSQSENEKLISLESKHENAVTDDEEAGKEVIGMNMEEEAAAREEEEETTKNEEAADDDHCAVVAVAPRRRRGENLNKKPRANAAATIHKIRLKQHARSSKREKE